MMTARLFSFIYVLSRFSTALAFTICCLLENSSLFLTCQCNICDIGNKIINAFVRLTSSLCVCIYCVFTVPIQYVLKEYNMFLMYY